LDRHSLGVGPCLETNGRDRNESGSLAGLEAAHLVHRRELFVVQSLVGRPSLDDAVALVELELDLSVDGPLTGRDGGGQEFTLGGEEVTVVEDPGEFDGDELITERTDVPVQGHSLEVHVGNPQDGRTRGFVTTPRLDADESVLDNVDPADSVLPGERVELQKDLDGVGVDGSGAGDGDLGGQTSLELDDDLLGLVGGVFRGSGQLPHVGGRGGVGVLENTSLVRDVEQVLVGRPRLGGGLDDGNTVLSGVLEEGRSTGESVVEFCDTTPVTPLAKCNDLDFATPATLDPPGNLQGAMTLMVGFNP
jgi:hypothetical protein